MKKVLIVRTNGRISRLVEKMISSQKDILQTLLVGGEFKDKNKRDIVITYSNSYLLYNYKSIVKILKK